MKTIISLTSYPPRMDVIPKTIRSLLAQSITPDLIVLYLAEDQFPGKKLPGALNKLAAENKNFQIRWVSRDTRAHKKLTPALRDFPDDVIITADDDVIYPSDWLARLIAAHKKYPGSITGHHVYRMEPDKPYKKWRKIQNRWWRKIFLGRPSFKNFATGVGGILYPPNALHPDAQNEELFMRLAPTADDVWFWAMAALNGTKVAVVPDAIKRMKESENSQEVSLWAENTVDDRNNKILDAVMRHYPELRTLI
ncbi:MAG: glycosyltransferase [Alphaproteobacteria bacterium]|nr:glycosyltransferase [Alphaproteobacteria bacterium]